MKNLIEAGFDVTGFDSNSYIGGLWHYTEEGKTSVLPSKHEVVHRVKTSLMSQTATVINISKERVSDLYRIRPLFVMY